VTQPEAAAAVAAAAADSYPRIVATLIRITGDWTLAEDCAQDAFAQALATWPGDGIPAKPGAWLTTVARRRAVDLRRRDSTLARRLPLLLDPSDPDAVPGLLEAEPEHEVADDRLRLIFTCCHPALATSSQVALTLRLVCGLSTLEVARAFLVSEPTMAARITRAKKKIAAARIPYRVPAAAELPARIAAVLTVVHLVFTTGHTAPAGEQLIRRDLVERALDLARMLRVLRPDDREVAGLLALLLLTEARSPARQDDGGELALLADQDRSRWDRDAIDEGLRLVPVALRRPPAGRFGLMAAIAAVHAQAPGFEDTAWGEIVALYDHLARVWPSPVVALNRAAAIGFARGPAAGLEALDELADEPQLAAYGYLAAARADFLRRLGRTAEARDAYEEALHLTENAVERRFLERRLAELDD